MTQPSPQPEGEDVLALGSTSPSSCIPDILPVHFKVHNIPACPLEGASRGHMEITPGC